MLQMKNAARRPHAGDDKLREAEALHPLRSTARCVTLFPLPSGGSADRTNVDAYTQSLMGNKDITGKASFLPGNRINCARYASRLLEAAGVGSGWFKMRLRGDPAA